MKKIKVGDVVSYGGVRKKVYAIEGTLAIVDLGRIEYSVVEPCGKHVYDRVPVELLKK
jgi:hypothetical protein